MPISFHWTIMIFPICIIFVWMMLRQYWQCIFIRARMESDWGLEFGSRICEIQVPQVKWTLETELRKADQNGNSEISCCMYINSCYGRYFFAHSINFQVESCGNQRIPQLLQLSVDKLGRVGSERDELRRIGSERDGSGRIGGKEMSLGGWIKKRRAAKGWMGKRWVGKDCVGKGWFGKGWAG